MVGKVVRAAFYLSNDFTVKVQTMILRQDSASGSLGVILKCLIRKTHFDLTVFKTLISGK